MERLKGKVAIITGGASGIGESTVRLFAEEGCRVVIADVQDAKGEELSKSLGENAAYIHTDVSSETDVKAAVDLAVSKFGRLDCIFNNAGIGEDFIPVEKIEMRTFEKIVKINMGGVFLGMKYAAAVMKRQGSGSIISTASVAGLQSGNAGHIYSAMKSAIIGLTRVVATELGESGVRVNCICPGGIVTPIFTAGLENPELKAQRMKFIEEVFSAYQPIRRAGKPEDIANAALWLAGDESSFVNGQAIVVDGGLTCGHQWSATVQGNEELRKLKQ